MKVYENVTYVELDPDAIEPIRSWEQEDLDHIKDAVMELQELTGATALPGLESVYHQIALRIKNYPKMMKVKK